LAHIRTNTEPGILRPGGYVETPARKKHRVEWTAPKEPTVWLAEHARATE